MTVPETRKRRSDNVRRLAAFLILFGFWLILSGHFDRLHLSLGLICASLVAFFSHDLLIPDGAAPQALLKAWRFIQYAPWLLYQVFLANLYVVSLVIDPRELRPRIVRFNTSLRSNLAKVSLGNSITLTPGTITMDIVDGEFYVHAVSDKVAGDLLTREMERRVAHVFLEPEPER